MAFAGRIGPSIGELIEAVTQVSAETEPEKFKRYTDSALRILKPNQYLRTNQFEVEKNLNGLEERFRVNGRDALADALEKRRAILEEAPSKWHPEILFLLLDLSDQPTFNSKLSDLDLLRSDIDDDEAPHLRWEDIAKEDGWEQDVDIWKRPRNYGESSDDEEYEDGSDTESEASLLSSEESVVEPRAAHLITHPENIKDFNLARQAQEWRNEGPATDSSGHARKVPVTEFHIVREVLFMLQGLDTTLFSQDGTADPAYQMAHIAWGTHKALINHFSEAGRQLDVLRRFAAQKQSSSHLQVFHDSVASRLLDFDRTVSELQRQLLTPSDHVVISLLSIKGGLASMLEPLCSLSAVVAQILDVPNSGAFRYLELLFEEASLAQLAGRLPVYEFFARIFAECFAVYLRPIRLWMDEGRLLPGDKMFFVSEAPTRVPLPKIWQDQYRLRRTADGALHAPKFLQPAAHKIFNAGKNIVVLKQLSRHAASNFKSKDQEPRLDYDAICPSGLELAPFPELFDAAFERWIQSKYSTTSSTLRDALFRSCGLWTALDTLEHLYFMSNGAAVESFCNNLFGKLDALFPGWSNRYTLTSTAQEAFSSLLDPSRLSVHVGPDGLHLTVQQARDTVRKALPTIKVNYRLAWPIQMILSEESVLHYHSIFTLLLQVRRASYVLHKQKLLEYYWTDDENWDERALYYSLRSKLLWFCATFQTYLATLVLAPNSSKMRADLAEAHDVDAMITVHGVFLKRVIDEACLGTRLTPIRECVLDILDLAIKLEQAESSNHRKRAAQEQELSLLSPAKGRVAAGKSKLYARDSDDEGEGEDHDEEPTVELEKPYVTVLKEVKADFDRHLRFICGGLRSVARASSDAQSAKWDILAEMLQAGTGSSGER